MTAEDDAAMVAVGVCGILSAVMGASMVLDSQTGIAIAGGMLAVGGGTAAFAGAVMAGVFR